MSLLDTAFNSNISNITTITTHTINSTGMNNITTTPIGLSSNYNYTNFPIIPTHSQYKSFTTNFISNINNEMAFKNHGWFNMSIYITKYINTRNDAGIRIARCLFCYITKPTNQHSYSRILNNSDNFPLFPNNFDRVICVCNTCTKQIEQGNIKMKNAPRNVHEVLLDYLINEQFDLLLSELEKLGKNTMMHNLRTSIEYMRFNINEKVVLLNNLKNENEKLSKNLDIEIEKHKLFFEHKNKNNELIKRFKKQFTDLTIDIFNDSKRTLDEHISKYQELNQTSKYSIPECRICMQNEVKIAIQCGHLLCGSCHSTLQNNSKQQQRENPDESNEHDDTICCPLCRTYCNTYTQIYF